MMACALRLSAGVAVAVALIAPGEVSAIRVIAYTQGETIIHIGYAPDQTKQSHGVIQVGYKYRYVAVAFVDLWTSDGTYCVYEGHRYKPIPSAEAARLLGKDEGELTTPFLYRWPLGWMLFPFLFVGAIGLCFLIAGLGGGENNDNEVTRLFQDFLYQRALAILNERYTASAEATSARVAEGENGTLDDGGRFHEAFQAGVDHLVGTGVARDEAERNLAVMVLALTSQQEATVANGGSAEPGVADNKPPNKPCPACGRPLRTNAAKQCFSCGADWH